MIEHKPKDQNQRFKRSTTTNPKNRSTNPNNRSTNPNNRSKNPNKIIDLQTQITENREIELESLNLREREREIIMDLNW